MTEYERVSLLHVPYAVAVSLDEQHAVRRTVPEPHYDKNADSQVAT